MRPELSVAVLATTVALHVSALANEHTDKLVSMTEKDRNMMWTALLKASGEKCDRVVRTMLQGTGRREDSWNVGCRDGNEYSVGIRPGPEGKTQILGCKMLEFVTKGTSKCWEKF
jgi:hypothetical protein